MRKKFLYVLFPLLFITFGTSAQRTTVIKATDNIQPVTVNSIDGVGWADAIVTSPTTGNIYWTYIASNFDAVIVKIEPGGTTTSHVLEDVGSIPDNNNHAEVCLSIDSEGYLHWMGGHHNSSPNYYRSSNPEDITSWDFYGNDLANGGMQGDRITYQNFFRANDGTLFVAYRNNFLDQFSYMGMRSIFLGRYDVNTEKWTFFGGLDYELTYINSSTCNDPTTGEEDIQMNAFVWENTGVGDGTTCPSTGHYQGYQLKVAFDEDNGMHVTYNMAYNINSDYNDLANNDPSKMMTHVFYAYSPDLGDTWYKADGTQITHFPMGIDDGDLVYSRYPDGYTYPDLAPHYNMSNGIYIVIDANGDPAINQTVFSAGNLASEKFFKWDGSQWADVSNDIVFDDLTNAHTSFDRD
ncbi:MAG: BNR-4 repeat-containing protein, partial [Bacteroidota bacterium]